MFLWMLTKLGEDRQRKHVRRFAKYLSGQVRDLQDELAFERKLYMIRKQAENWAKERGLSFLLC